MILPGQAAIVILNWNGVKMLKQFLPGVIRYSEGARIVVADNDSTDGSLSYLESLGSKIEIIRLDRNYGFTGGYNRALKQVQAEYYILLNSDVEVTAGWLNDPLRFLDENKLTAACQPKIRSYSERELFEHAGGSGGFIDYLGYPFCRGRLFTTLEKDTSTYNDCRYIFWATGACMFIRAADFHEQNGFDEYFFAHMEEIDLCWRLQQSGKRIAVVPSSVVYHVGGGTLPKSSPRKTYYNFRNNLLMLHKNLPASEVWFTLPLRIILDGIAGLKFFIEGDFADMLAVIKAHFAFYSVFASRISIRRNQQKRAVSNEPVGMYNRSIVKDYYVHKIRKFSSLQANQFSKHEDHLHWP